MNYQDIARAIITAVRDVIGDVALRQANQLDFVTVTDDGVTVEADLEQQDITALLDVYHGIIGDAVYGIARNAIDDLEADTAEDMDLDLPDEITDQ